MYLQASRFGFLSPRRDTLKSIVSPVPVWQPEFPSCPGCGPESYRGLTNQGSHKGSGAWQLLTVLSWWLCRGVAGLCMSLSSLPGVTLVIRTQKCLFITDIVITPWHKSIKIVLNWHWHPSRKYSCSLTSFPWHLNLLSQVVFEKAVILIFHTLNSRVPGSNGATVSPSLDITATLKRTGWLVISKLWL